MASTVLTTDCRCVDQVSREPSALDDQSWASTLALIASSPLRNQYGPGLALCKRTGGGAPYFVMFNPSGYAILDAHGAGRKNYLMWLRPLMGVATQRQASHAP